MSGATAGWPISIKSIPNKSNFFARFNFCSIVKNTPGVCSPSLNVESSTSIFLSSKINDSFVKAHPLKKGKGLFFEAQ